MLSSPKLTVYLYWWMYCESLSPGTRVFLLLSESWLEQILSWGLAALSPPLGGGTGSFLLSH